MTAKIRWAFVTVAFLFVALYGYGFNLKLKRAKMASQCAVLAADIANYITETGDAGKSPNIDEFLSHYDGRGLLTRNSSGQLIDSWGKPLLIQYVKISDKPGVTVTSTGLDGKLGTDDDFSREFTLAPKEINPQ